MRLDAETQHSRVAKFLMHAMALTTRDAITTIQTTQRQEAVI